MKLIKRIVPALAACLLLHACVSEPAELDLNIDVNKTEVDAGESVVWTISGTADFITFYSGLPGSSYSEYPDANSLNVSLATGNEFEYTYNNLDSTIRASFVASSYGDWSTDSRLEIFDFDITVVDNRTGIASFVIKTGGLFGKEFTGVVNEDNSTISVAVDAGTSLSSVTTTIITKSTLAKVYLEGEEFQNKSKVDYSGGDVVFEVRAKGGATQDWTVKINFV